MDRMRLLLEGCDFLQGIVFHIGIGGGSGGGLASCILERLFAQSEFPKTPKVVNDDRSQQKFGDLEISFGQDN